MLCRSKRKPLSIVEDTLGEFLKKRLKTGAELGLLIEDTLKVLEILLEIMMLIGWFDYLLIETNRFSKLWDALELV